MKFLLWVITGLIAFFAPFLILLWIFNYGHPFWVILLGFPATWITALIWADKPWE
jgi:hypothetical protein